LRPFLDLRNHEEIDQALYRRVITRAGGVVCDRAVNLLWSYFRPKFVFARYHQNKVIFVSGLFLTGHSVSKRKVAEGDGAMDAMGNGRPRDVISLADVDRSVSDILRFDSNLPKKIFEWWRGAMDNAMRWPSSLGALVKYVPS
jgi:hypothetical protein